MIAFIFGMVVGTFVGITMVALVSINRFEEERRMTEREALDYIITYVGCATFGKGRWFRQEDGTYYDRLFEDYVDLGIVAYRVVETVRERDEE